MRCVASATIEHMALRRFVEILVDDVPALAVLAADMAQGEVGREPD